MAPPPFFADEISPIHRPQGESLNCSIVRWEWRAVPYIARVIFWISPVESDQVWK